MRVVRMFFWFWLLLADMMLVMDVISYYKILHGEDWYQLVNRDLNVIFIHWFVVLPFTILVFYLIRPLNKLNELS
tara:strand:+ start:111 stop:335 length:225 start_codon:yes stop_codon:yes gene_type:complete